MRSMNTHRCCWFLGARAIGIVTISRLGFAVVALGLAFAPTRLAQQGRRHVHEKLSMTSPGDAHPSQTLRPVTTTTTDPQTPDAFVRRAFLFDVNAGPYSSSSSSSSSSSPLSLPLSGCEDANVPPALRVLLRSLDQLTGTGGSDVRGKFVDHARLGSPIRVAHEIGRISRPGSPAALTPFAAHCLGHALASMLHDNDDDDDDAENDREGRRPGDGDGGGGGGGGDIGGLPRPKTIVIGIDPRPHSMRLADALARGAESYADRPTRVVYTGIATTPACASFVRACAGVDASVMVTASHLPIDRNGFKLFTSATGPFSAAQVSELGRRAKHSASLLFEQMSIPPMSGDQSVFCSEWVDYMPTYLNNLKGAIVRHVLGEQSEEANEKSRPLQGLRIVLNAGNGSGGFLGSVLSDLGADVSGSVNLEPDGTFPAGIPNPEYAPMVQETIRACQSSRADVGIMLDTDADRCGFVVPTDRTYSRYEPLHRNRLIALLGVMFSQSNPGCAIVTDSVTSENLTAFLNDALGLRHVRYLKGYANVINKAQELSSSGSCDAQVAIETSGHCAMRENQYLDDGTYTAAKVVSWLAKHRDDALLIDWIAGYRDLPEVSELRMSTFDQSLETMRSIFDVCAVEIEMAASDAPQESSFDGFGWEVDRQNLEGIRVRVGEGQFFMLRKSLHDPIVSLQIEALSTEHAKCLIVEPLLNVFLADGGSIAATLDLEPLRAYARL